MEEVQMVQGVLHQRPAIEQTQQQTLRAPTSLETTLAEAMDPLVELLGEWIGLGKRLSATTAPYMCIERIYTSCKRQNQMEVAWLKPEIRATPIPTHTPSCYRQSWHVVR